MKITYLKLADDSLIINLPSGPHIINKRTVNYNLVLKALQSSASLSTLQSLLFPKLVEGIYYAYLLYDKLLIHRIDLAGNHHIFHANGGNLDQLPLEAVFLGAYTSKQDLLNNHPEYLI